MKALASVALVLAVCLSTIARSSAAADKTLSNVRGTVSLDQGPGTTSQPVGVSASVAIADNDFAVTGGVVNGIPSQGAIQLPDSTRILIGQMTRVQMTKFDQVPNLTTANFIIINGKIRFTVQHPGGAKANYTFQTSTGQIAVRGTEGDIWAPQPGALQVNVYQVTDPSLPVEVTLNNGKVYKLSAGQTLTVGTLGAVVSSTNQQSENNFSEFGLAGAGTEAAPGVAAAGASSGGGFPAVAAIVAGVGAIGGVIIGTSSHGSGGSSSPTPAKVTVNPTALTFTPGTGPLTFQASQSGFSGTFHASIDRPAIASVNASSSDGTFTVTPKSDGTATITVKGSGASAPVGITVQAKQIVVPGALPTFTSLNQSQNFTAQEIYYAGSFTANSKDAKIAKVTSSSSAGGRFTVTSVGNGSTTITISDTLGHSAPVNVTVSTPKPSPTPTSIPICIGMGVGDDRAKDARHHVPAGNPTCTPPPAARPVSAPVVRAPQPQPHPVGPQPPIMLPPRVPGMPTPPPMPGSPP